MGFESLIMIDNIQTIYPSSDFLKKYIYCYYIIDSGDYTFKSVHYSFPHVFNSISIYNDVRHNMEFAKIIKEKDSSKCLLQGKRLEPVLVELKGKVRRITILFKEFGLNHFIEKPLGEIIRTETVVFKEWNSEALDKTVCQFFYNKNLAEGINLLEDFLRSVYLPFELLALEKSLVYLKDFDKEKSVEEIANLIDMPLRTFNRLFKLHLGVSPSIYRQIARFRHSLEDKIFEEKFRTLTEIVYNSNYYDQAYFNKLYKQLTGSNPRKFFNAVEKIGDTKLVFQYLDK
ncbi:MAG: helix-turn-helix domain-containing protein [Arachidicoccus sp.]|nr:helix-turn-helix domain-containing protein [Arachidicoccus sp.]